MVDTLIVDCWSCGKDVALSANRKRHNPEYREQALRLVVDTGRPVARTGAEIGVGEQLRGR